MHVAAGLILMVVGAVFLGGAQGSHPYSEAARPDFIPAGVILFALGVLIGPVGLWPTANR